jgi:hypothetical protein
MPNAISLENFNYYLNYFNKLKKAGLNFEIQKIEKYVTGDASTGAYYQLVFYPTFKKVESIVGLASIWTAAPAPVSLDSIESFPTYSEILKNPCCIKINGDLYRKNNPAVKFYAASVFDNNVRTSLYLIDKPVPETTVAGHSYRHCIQGGIYTGGQLVYCSDESAPYFNYIDQGHVMVYVSTGHQTDDGNRFFVTDSVTLDMNYIIAAASIHPPVLDDILQHKAFLPSKDSRMTLMKVERAIPAKLRDEYVALKNRIQEDFSKNTSSVMIGKLTRKESDFININGIKITSTRADYVAGHVTIEAPNLAEVVFAKLNPNETEWDIFTLINIYTDWVNDQFKNLPLNAEGTGFAAEKSFNFKINDIPLKVSCSTENTRRSINDHLINVDELSPVLKRASCYQVPEDETEEDNIKNFDKFICDVSRYSLKTRDIWANGLPVKTVFLECDRNGYNRPATHKHPKLRFVLKDKKTDKNKGFHLVVNVMDAKDKNKIIKTNEYRIGKFAEFIKKVEALNKSTSMRYHTDYTLTSEGFYVPRSADNANPCATGLTAMLSTYAEGITEEDKKSLVGTINYELSEAEKRSEELLNEACLITNTKPGVREGKKGYIIPGKMRTYFVEEEGQMKVWDYNPKEGQNPYFCVVNKGDMGVGKDALVARIFALHNDEMMVKHIHTLKK